MSQEIKNEGGVQSQLNAANVEGSIYFSRKSRFAKRFEKLNQEIKSDQRYEGIMEALKYYLTKQDGIDAETKLKDGGFSEREIIKAIKSKENYAKKLQKNRFFESAQWIDSQLFAKIKMNFDAFIIPLVNSKASKDEIMTSIVKNVIQPVLDLLNTEGEDDEYLNYNADDIFGMVYYLTGQCHLNWTDYDSI